MNRHGKPWIESMLVAYVDGQLDPAQRVAVDDILREDLEARTIVSVLRGTGEAVRAAFEQPLHEAVPPRLLGALAAAGGKATNTVVPIRRPAKVALKPRLLALAASVAILFVGIGMGIGYRELDPARGLRPAEGESVKFEAVLRRVLERGEPGAPMSYDDAAVGRRGSVIVLGKIDTIVGDNCREFRHEWTDARGKGLETGLACRSATGDWPYFTVPREPAS